MKLFSKLYLIFSLMTSSLHARETILLTYDENISFTLQIEKIITDLYKVPISLITKMKSHSPCHPQHRSVLHICIKNNNKVEFLVINKEVILNAFKIFRN